tara:strand:+ start:1445 stop:1930 length:486 start_codon:yes stop_codon:yes gene_type:complete
MIANFLHRYYGLVATNFQKNAPMTQPPQWIQDLTYDATEEIHAFDVLAPVGCHYHQIDSQWEVTIFASRTEVVGGPKDGTQTSSNFSLNLNGVYKLLDDVTEFRWQALPVDEADDLGPHVSLVGTRDGHPVWLRILAQAPVNFEPGRFISAYDGNWDEAWT